VWCGDKFEVTVSEIADLANLKNTNAAYLELKKAADRLLKRRKTA
jgi:hypothetical protein